MVLHGSHQEKPPLCEHSYTSTSRILWVSLLIISAQLPRPWWIHGGCAKPTVRSQPRPGKTGGAPKIWQFWWETWYMLSKHGGYSGYPKLDFFGWWTWKNPPGDHGVAYFQTNDVTRHVWDHFRPQAYDGMLEVAHAQQWGRTLQQTEELHGAARQIPWSKRIASRGELLHSHHSQ